MRKRLLVCCLIMLMGAAYFFNRGNTAYTSTIEEAASKAQITYDEIYETVEVKDRTLIIYGEDQAEMLSAGLLQKNSDGYQWVMGAGSGQANRVSEPVTVSFANLPMENVDPEDYVSIALGSVNADDIAELKVQWDEQEAKTATIIETNHGRRWYVIAEHPINSDPYLTGIDHAGDTVYSNQASESTDSFSSISYVNQEHKLRITGEMKSGMISDFMIRFGGKEAGPFTWSQSQLREPLVYLEDISGDGEPELILVTIYDHGTGIILSDAHVMSKDLAEAVVEPAQDIIQEKVKFSGRNVYLENKLLYSAAEHGDLKPLLEDYQEYKVVNGKLIGCVRIGDGKAEQYAGYLEIEYAFSGGKYAAKEIRHVGDSELSHGSPLAMNKI